MSILGDLFSIFSANKAKDDAKDQAREEARLEGIVTDEQLRRLDREKDFTLAAQRVGTA